MVSKVLGRTPCPIGCGHTAAHVKLKTDKPTAAYPYVHCRGCGIQINCRNEEQASYLLAITRPEVLDAPGEAPPTPTPTPRREEMPPLMPIPTPTQVPRRLFGRAP